MFDILNIISVCIGITSLVIFSLRNYKFTIYTYAFQTFLLVGIFILLAFRYDAYELKIWAIVAFLTKVVFIPIFLMKLVKRLKVENEVEPVLGFFVSPIIAIAFSLATAMTIYPIFLEFSLIKESIALIVSITVFMLGFFAFILRNSVIKQILAYCMLENGVHLSLALMAHNSHEIAELGILTDAIFAIIIMSILSERFFQFFKSLDSSKANELKG